MPHTHLRLVGDDTTADLEATRILGSSGDAFLLSVIRQSPDCIKIIEPGGRLAFMNFNGQCAMQIDDFETVRGVAWDALWPDASRRLIVEAVEKGFAGEASRFEAACPTARGEPRWWEVAVSPIQGADGTVERLVSISRDITAQVERERRLAEQEAQLAALTRAQAEQIEARDRTIATGEVVMREVDHRVKNSLNLVASMLKMQARTIDGAARTKLREAADRVAMIARVHEQIYSSASMTEIEMDAFLDGLCDRLLEANGASDVLLHGQFCKRTLTGSEAVSLGLILAELIGNALRHGLAGRRGGALRIACEEVGNGRTRLIVGDDGAGFPDGFDLRLAEGLGAKVVQAYAAKLGGDVRTGRSALGGAEVSVVF